MSDIRARPADIPEAVRRRCVYCLNNGHLTRAQILVRGRHLYLSAPRGQLVEGFLAIAPLACVGSLSTLPGEWFTELSWLRKVVSEFYLAAYGVGEGTFYEQGRGGGGALFDEAAGFPHHAHLCCLPLALDLHTPLGAQYLRKTLAGVEELPSAAAGSPYLYVEGPDGEGLRRRCAYLPETAEAGRELERVRLKPLVAALLGLHGRGDWRNCPDDRELESLIRRFGEFRGRAGAGGVTDRPGG